MHPRNRHQSRYDLKKLCRETPALLPFVTKDTIDFTHAEAVKTLNQAILKSDYKIKHWDIPEHYLCPPIPGRADYLHHLKDLIGKKDHVHGLDIGVGANVIYPLLGVAEYHWSFVASDVDPIALASAKKIIKANDLTKNIELRLQSSSERIFRSIILEKDLFDFTMCNPPFHASRIEALSGTQRKWKNLGKKNDHNLNFGGQSGELWCKGGEKTFIQKMIEESASFSTQCKWFTTLVSKEKNLVFLKHELQKVHANRVEVITMAQGQKKSRILAWSF